MSPFLFWKFFNSKFADHFYSHMTIGKFAIKKLLKKEDVINHYNDKLQNPI